MIRLSPAVLAFLAAQAGSAHAIDVRAPWTQTPPTGASNADAGGLDAALRDARDRLARARAAQKAKDPASARAEIERAIRELVALPAAAESKSCCDVLLDLGQGASNFGDFPLAREALKCAVDERTRRLAEDDVDLQTAESSYAFVLRSLGALAEARALEEKVLAACEKSLPEDDPRVLKARWALALTVRRSGKIDLARALLEKDLAAYERTSSEDDRDLQGVRLTLATIHESLGDLPGARAMLEKVCASLERTLPPGHRDLMTARQDLALVLREQGELHRARSIFADVLATREGVLPETNPELQAARLNLAMVLGDLGDLHPARALEEKAVAALEQVLPDVDPQLLNARMNLSATLAGLGDLAAARALQERVVGALEKVLGDDHRDVQSARFDLASVESDLGDRAAARALQEKALALMEKKFGDDHPDVQTMRLGLANTLNALGEREKARPLVEKVLAAREKSLPADHPDLQLARENLASLLSQLGDLRGAHELHEKALEAYEISLPADNPRLLMSRLNAAESAFWMGADVDPVALGTSVIEPLEKLLPPGNLDRLGARTSWITMLATKGGAEPIAQMGPALTALAADIDAALESAHARSPRESAERGASISKQIDALLSFAPPADEALERRAFALIEDLRALGPSVAAGWDSARDDQIEARRESARAARKRLNDGVAAGSGDSTSLADLARARDQAEVDLARSLRAKGFAPPRIEAGVLAAKLSPHSIAVGYARYERWLVDPKKRSMPVTQARLLANVVDASGKLVRVELGPLSAVESAVTAWREAVGAPLGRARIGGEPARAADGVEIRARGRALRELVLDPVLAAGIAAGAKTIFVCADDALNLVPLDALPKDEGFVGDVLTVRNETSFARLIAPSAGIEVEPALLALGGAAFDAEVEPSVGSASIAAVRAAAPRNEPQNELDRTRRETGAARPWSPLPGTRGEVASIAALFRQTFSKDGTLLVENEATKSAFETAATHARWIHVATHGYFAPESVQSAADARLAGRAWTPMTVAETVTGLAPMTLCGLALAGANRGMDSLGRVSGIITGEELAGLDLSRCELAVLSACETNLGVQRAGLGMHSLQAALHAAGVRTAITSLWRVDDARARELMQDFYTRVWVGKEPKADALWHAKGKLRDERAKLRDWAGWILTGDPR